MCFQSARFINYWYNFRLSSLILRDTIVEWLKNAINPGCPVISKQKNIVLFCGVFLICVLHIAN